MANNFYNNSVLNYEQHPSFCNNTGPNGCRLCNQVFTNTHALLTHIESHMAQEEVAIRRLYSSPQHHHHVNSQTHQFPSPPNMSHAMIFQAQPQPQPQPQSQPKSMGIHHPVIRSPFFNVATSQVGSSSQHPIRQMQIPPQSLPHARSFGVDGLNLEKPIMKADFIDLVNVDDDNNSKVEPLDLDLKL
ncbi:hypothetical protein Fmac_028127 [Flemingia macrophylla]|uniref:C2H2-type domain-containing protein n=1 Tax=Flemingia macrophylla TaxID=520843 RepID=A0ABD1LK99_9FABA